MDTLFFTLSKLAWAFLSPSNLLLLSFILGTLLLLMGKVWGKRLLILGSLIAIPLWAYPFGDYLIQPLETRFNAPENFPEHIDGIIVLGGGEDLHRSLSWGRPELGNGGDRYIGAKELANRYPNVPIIFTGGSGSMQLQNTGGEGSIAKRLFTTLNIEPQRLIIESKSRNTYENLLKVKPLLPNPNGTYFLVTSAYHMPRSVGIARQQDVNVIPYPVDYRSSSDEIRRLDFDFYGHLDTLEPAWREWIGLTVYYLTHKTDAWFPAP